MHRLASSSVYRHPRMILAGLHQGLVLCLLLFITVIVQLKAEDYM